MVMLGQLGLTILVWASLKARQDKKNKELRAKEDSRWAVYNHFVGNIEERVSLINKNVTENKRRDDFNWEQYADLVDSFNKSLGIIENSRQRIGLLESDYTRVSNKLKRLTPAKPKTNTARTQTTKTKK